MMNRRGGTLARVGPPGTYTTTTYARAVGVSIDTVKRWRALDVLVPSGEPVKVGSTVVQIYTEEDVEEGLRLKNGRGNLKSRAS